MMLLGTVLECKTLSPRASINSFVILGVLKKNQIARNQSSLLVTHYYTSLPNKFHYDSQDCAKMIKAISAIARQFCKLTFLQLKLI